MNNTSDQEGSYTISVNQAYTNAQGFIDYSDANGAKNNDLPYKIDDLVSYEQKISLDANSSKEVPIQISMPQKSFDGEISTAIQVLKEQKKSEKQINIDYGYILGLKLTQTDNAIKREMKLLKVEPDVSFGQPSVMVTLENPTMDAYGHLKYVVKIKNKKDKKEVYSKIYDNNMEMAPNSFYQLAINTKDQRLIDGDYTLDLVASDAKNNEWTFNEEFTITKKQADRVNSVIINQQMSKISPYVWFFIISLLLLISVLLVFVYRRRKSSRSRPKHVR